MKKFYGFLKVFVRAFSCLHKFRKTYILGTVLYSFELVLLFATPVINQILVEAITVEANERLISTIVGLFLLFLLLVPLVIVGKFMQMTATVKSAAELQKLLFRKITALPYVKIIEYKTGDFIIRMTNDATRTVSAFSGFPMTCLVRFVVVFSISLILLFQQDWRIAITGIIYGAISLVLSIYLNPFTNRLEGEAKLEIVKSANFLMETLRGIPVVKVFALYPMLSKKYQNICGVIKQKKVKFTTINGATYGIIDFFAFSAQAVGFFIGMLLAGENIALGKAVFNATLMGMMGDAMLRLSSFLLLIQPNLVAMERVFDLLDQPEEDTASSCEILNMDYENAVTLLNVSFSYGEDNQVLDNVNLTLKRGERLAIVGESGCGKSTLLKIMEGFYAPTGGEIIYYGKSKNKMSKSDIRKLFAYVSQECHLFDGSIGENIALGNPGVSQQEIEDAANLAGIHNFIKYLPKEYGTPVGERGSQLSGGQKQRIAIARAILKGAPILLLDEATAALDSATEKEVQSCLESISEGMTTVTVAHRLSTINNADRIIVMEAGKIIEEGSFSELIQKNGKFKLLYKSQVLNKK